jgi:hypothetical protein
VLMRNSLSTSSSKVSTNETESLPRDQSHVMPSHSDFPFLGSQIQGGGREGGMKSRWWRPS